MTTITEADVEQAALAWLSALGWQVAQGPEIAPDAAHAERGDYGQFFQERKVRHSYFLMPQTATNIYHEPRR